MVMNETLCETILIQKSALLDGEAAELSDKQIASHLANCEDCSREIPTIGNTIVLLNSQTRQTQMVSLWPAIKRRIDSESKPASLATLLPFVSIGAFLLIGRLVEMFPDRDFGWALKVLPIFLIVVLFVVLRENPFRIKRELTLE